MAGQGVVDVRLQPQQPHNSGVDKDHSLYLGAHDDLPKNLPRISITSAYLQALSNRVLLLNTAILHAYVQYGLQASIAQGFTAYFIKA